MTSPANEPTPTAPPAAPGVPAEGWPVLTVPECRVLGVLIEKAKTTPAAYPLSINALVTGCNQKSNREPVLDMTEDELEEALVSAQQKRLTIKITGGARVVRWRHNLYEAWHVDKVELAILGELLLRGAQTEGELRGRASRMEPIDDLDALRSALKPLAARRLVVYLSPEGKRGTVLTHGFHTPNELDQLRATRGAEPIEPETPRATLAGPAPARAVVASASPGSDLRDEVVNLRTLVTGLQTELATVKDQLRLLQESLGVTPSRPVSPSDDSSSSGNS